MNRARRERTPYWPDRSALRRRRHARRVFWLAVALVVLLPWLGYRQLRDWIGPAAVDAATPPVAAPGPIVDTAGVDGTASLVAPQAAGGPVDDATADEVAAIGRDARAGDGEGAVARLAGLGAQAHRQALLADRGSAVRREAARRDVSAMPGVRAAGWVDRMTMLLLASSHGSGHATIAEACRRLSAHGDVAGLAVRVQEVAAGSAAAALQGDCHPVPAGTAGEDARLPFPGTALRVPGVRLSGEDAGQPGEDPAAAAERRRREEESLRILSEGTPELPVAPDPRAGPGAH